MCRVMRIICCYKLLKSAKVSSSSSPTSALNLSLTSLIVVPDFAKIPFRNSDRRMVDGVEAETFINNDNNVVKKCLKRFKVFYLDSWK